jgi:chorismate mutase
MTVRGIRGATTVNANKVENIIEETKILIERMISINKVENDDIASIFFSVTHDLDCIFPAAAARELNLDNTPLLCLNEINIPGSLEKCIRILMHINTKLSQKEIKHVYLNEAVSLRPEFAQ